MKGENNMNITDIINKYQTWYKGVEIWFQHGTMMFTDNKTGCGYHVHNEKPIIHEILRIYSEIGIMRRCCGIN